MEGLELIGAATQAADSFEKQLQVRGASRSSCRVREPPGAVAGQGSFAEHPVAIFVG